MVCNLIHGKKKIWTDFTVPQVSWWQQWVLWDRGWRRTGPHWVGPLSSPGCQQVPPVSSQEGDSWSYSSAAPHGWPSQTSCTGHLSHPESVYQIKQI